MSLDELYGFGFDHYQKYSREIQKVTKEEVNQAAKRHLDLEAYAIAIIRPPLDKKE
jgi:predicted Zn-dependent peptidase